MNPVTAITAAIIAILGPSAAIGSTLAHGINPPNPDYWRNYGVEANALKRAYFNPSGFAGTYEDGWPVLTQNASASFEVVRSESIAHRPKPGKWVITVPGYCAVLLTVNGVVENTVGAVITSISPAGATIQSFNGGQLANNTATPMRIEFNYSGELETSSTFVFGGTTAVTASLRVRFMHTQASTTTSTKNCRVYHISSEADIVAGLQYTQEFINYISGGNPRAPLRVMPMFSPNEIFVTEASEIPPGDANSRVSVTPSMVSGAKSATLQQSTSPEAFAEMQHRSGKPLWVALPPMMTDAALTAFFTRLHASLTARYGSTAYDTHVFVEPSNELWNSSFASNSTFLADNYATSYPQGVTGVNPALSREFRMQKNGAHFALRAWSIAESILGRQRVKRTFDCQIAFYDGGARPMLEYVDPGIIQAGARAGDLADYVAGAPYFGAMTDANVQTRNDEIKNTAAYISANLSQYVPAARGVTTPNVVGTNRSISNTDILRGEYYLNGRDGKSFSEWREASLRNCLDWNNIGCRYFVSQLRLAGYTNPKLGIYEINTHEDLAQTLYVKDDEPYGVKVSYSAGLFTATSPNDGLIRSMELVKVVRARNSTTLVSSGTEGTFSGIKYLAKVRQDGSISLHANIADFNSDTIATGNPTGSLYLVNVSRIDALHRANINWLLHSPIGAEFIRRVDNVMAGVGFDVACWFADGGYGYAYNSVGVGTQPWTFADKGLWNTAEGHAAWKSLI